MLKCGPDIHRLAMAILICPSCGTRYEIQAVLLPEGRKARCYKCGQIWLARSAQAEPIGGAQPTSEAAQAERSSGAASVPETVAATVALSPSQWAAAVSLAQAFSGIQTAAPQ